MFLSYRNQSVVLLCKSADWFLYYKNIGRQKVKRTILHISLQKFFKPIHFQHKRQMFLEKTLEQGALILYSRQKAPPHFLKVGRMLDDSVAIYNVGSH